MERNRLVYFYVLFTFLISCSISSTRKGTLTSVDKKKIYIGDTIYLLKPKTIVRIHYGEKADEYRIDLEKSDGASTELTNGIKFFGEKKVKIIDLVSQEDKLREFYKRIKPFLDSAKRDTVNLAYDFSDPLKIILNGGHLNHPLIISDLEWDHDTKEFYDKIRLRYSGFYNGRYFFGHSTTFLKMHFVLINPSSGKIIKYRYTFWISAENREPVLQNFESDVQKVMRPFLRSVVERKEKNNQ